MRTKIVKVANKSIVINEKTIGELKKLSKEINVDLKSIADTDLKDKKTDDIVEVVTELIQSKLTVIFPTLTDEDIDNAYMSELEELIGGFIDINFLGMKKVFLKVTTMM